MKIIESPREGMQGLSYKISIENKVQYLNTLLNAGFDTVEIGSMASPKLIPQMADTLEVIRKLDLTETRSNRMVLAVDKKGADTLSMIEEVTHISYPFSFSPEFLRINLKSTIGQSIQTAGEILNTCIRLKKAMVLYFSMAFGNPYGDPWSQDLLEEWIGIFSEMGIETIVLSNVYTEISEAMISETFSSIIPCFQDIEFGLHLHTSSPKWNELIQAAWSSGCRRFDTVIHGLGGCPMTGRELLGNLKTENLLTFCADQSISTGIDQAMFDKACLQASNLFYH